MISIRDWQWQFPLPYNIHFSSNCQWHCTTVSQVLSIWTVGFCEFSCSFSFKCLLLVHFSFETDDALNTHVLALWNEVKSCNHVIVVYLVSLWHYFPSPPSFSVSDCRSNEMIAAEDDHTHTDRIKSQEIFQLETTISSENLRGLSLFLSFLCISYSNMAGKAHACIKAASPEEMKEEKNRPP